LARRGPRNLRKGEGGGTLQYLWRARKERGSLREVGKTAIAGKTRKDEDPHFGHFYLPGARSRWEEVVKARGKKKKERKKNILYFVELWQRSPVKKGARDKRREEKRSP